MSRKFLAASVAALICVSSNASSADIQAATTDLGGTGKGGYIPLDGAPVKARTCISPTPTAIDLPDALPDIASRFAVAELTGNAGVTYGPVQVTLKGRSYRAIVDYINVDVMPVKFWIRKNDKGGYDAETVDPSTDGYIKAVIPVYVGIGLRVSADIVAQEGKINLGSLAAIGASASASKLVGTITVQSLGINGKGVSAAIPLPSKLDATTVENAILAVGASRASIYDKTSGSVVLTPRIVGIYSTVGNDPKLIDAIYSELTTASVEWQRACKA
jgi:hypothetical protein